MIPNTSFNNINSSLRISTILINADGSSEIDFKEMIVFALVSLRISSLRIVLISVEWLINLLIFNSSAKSSNIMNLFSRI